MANSRVSSSAYIQAQLLKGGHSDTVNTLSFSSDGMHLASGGDDHTAIIWNVLKGQLLYRIVFENAVDCVMWHPVHPETVIVGLASGFLFQMHGFSLLNYHKHDINLGARSTVYCLDYDVTTRCLAIGMGEEVHLTREIERNDYQGDVVLPAPPEPSTRNEKADSRLRAVAVRFDKAGANVVVSYIGHGIICWNISSKEPEKLWSISMPTEFPNIGGSALSPDCRQIVVYNLVDGLNLYKAGTNGKQKPRRKFKLDRAPKSAHQLQIEFIHSGQAVICGTTTGNVILWDVTTGEVMQELSHSNDIIQAISAVEHSGHGYIATGSAAKGQDTYIKIWRAKIISRNIDAPEFSDAVAEIVQAVARTRQSLAKSTCSQFLEIMTGILILVALIWGSTIVPWPTVWGVTLDVIIYLYAAANQGAHHLLYFWGVASEYTGEVCSAMASSVVATARKAALSFLFPDDVQEAENRPLQDL